jgi:hypothetical protein
MSPHVVPSRSTTPVVSLLAALAALAAPVSAQTYLSEKGLVAQTVSGTTVTVEYYRPEAKGRELFGKKVPWGRPWTPGANWGTTVEVDHDLLVEGKPLPKGKYSVWVVPQADEWTVAFSKRARAFHTLRPPAEEDQLTFTVKPTQCPHVEVLTWSFPVVKQGPELHMQWGTTDLALHLTVTPLSATLSAEERAKYVGVYDMVAVDPRFRTRTQKYTVFDSAGVLRLRREVAPDNLYDPQYDLHPTAEHTFVPIMYQRGVLAGVEPAMAVVFGFEGGRATSVEVRGPGGGPMSKGVLRR